LFFIIKPRIENSKYDSIWGIIWVNTEREKRTERGSVGKKREKGKEKREGD
jgi:hypothetical protein